MVAARQLPPLPPDQLRSTHTATRQSNGTYSVTTLPSARSRSLPGRLATVVTTVARWLAGPLASTLVAAAAKARDAVLILAGIGLLAWAGWQVRPDLGAAVAGVLVLALYWALRPADEVELPAGLVIPVERLVVMLAAARQGLTDAEILPDVFEPEPEPEGQA